MNTAKNTLQWSYEILGSIGYHQVGQPLEFEKRNVEISVLKDLLRLPLFQTPEALQHYAHVQLVTFHHEAGDYDELCIYYDFIQLEEWELSDDANDNDLAALFYTWWDQLQQYDYESNDLLDYCQTIYEQRNGCTLPGTQTSLNIASLW